MELKPYDNYKDSGATWLGKVPSHWRVVPNRGTFTEVDDKNHPNEEMLSVTIGQGVIKQSTLIQDESLKDGSRIDKSNYKLVLPGDIAYNKMRAWQGAIGLSKYKGIISPAYVVQRPTPGNIVQFLHYLLRTPAFAKEAERWSYGIASDMWSLRPEHFKAISCSIPPPEEQAAIVRFLDHADEQIQRYIAGKERLITLLEEERQALIHQAVTRGLDLSVRLKPSGVEWLGDVPEHWEARRAKYLYREVDEHSETGTEQLMSVSHKTGVTTRKETVTMFLAESNIGHKLCRPGDIVINTMWAFMAALGVARQKGLVSPSYGVYRPHDESRLNRDYMDSLIRTEAYRINYLVRSTGITSSRLRLYPESFLGIPLVHPPKVEQDAIAEEIHKVTTSVDGTINRAQNQIHLMNEYRTRLIADVVTGQLDVRETAARLQEAP